MGIQSLQGNLHIQSCSLNPCKDCICKFPCLQSQKSSIPDLMASNNTSTVGVSVQLSHDAEQTSLSKLPQVGRICNQLWLLMNQRCLPTSMEAGRALQVRM